MRVGSCSVEMRKAVKLPVEACVVGGGPAGSAIAGRLATLGHAVVLVESESFPRPHVGESLPPGVLPLLDSLGVRDEVENAEFLRPRGAVVRWAGRTQPRAEAAGEPGFQVDRSRFDHILLRAAVSAGARVLQPARALAPTWRGPGDWVVPVRRPRGDGEEQVEARFLVDACGRRGLLGRCKRRLAPATVAVYGYWQGTTLGGPETRVEAAAEQWYWGAPLPDGTFNATVFVSPQRLRGAKEVEHAYRALLADSELLAGCLSGRMKGPVRVCAASACLDDEPVGEDWLKVGESALALDPLSSQGVQTALVSGLQGAAVVHTLLATPQYRHAALQFARERHAETARRHGQMAATFYHEQEQYCPAPFWRSRAAIASALPTRPGLPLVSAPKLTDKVVLSSETKFVRTPALCRDLIRPVQAILPPGSDRPVAFLGGVLIAPLVKRISGEQTVREVLDCWSTVSSPQLASNMLFWTVQHAVLVRS
jgi:flavin-dependent dehydrogenase